MSVVGMPEIGSKINLISKANIRYEGRLFTIDSQKSTIALAHVRSFGTEDRESESGPIAPQNQIYDYILFRGSDIKDIRVVNANISQTKDPAIVHMQLPDGHHLMPQFSMPMMSMNPGLDLISPFHPLFQREGLGGNSLALFAAYDQKKQQHASGSGTANSGSNDQRKIQGTSRPATATAADLRSKNAVTADIAVQVNKGPVNKQKNVRNAGENLNSNNQRSRRQSGPAGEYQQQPRKQQQQRGGQMQQQQYQRVQNQNRSFNGGWNNRSQNQPNYVRNNAGRGRGSMQQRPNQQGGYREQGFVVKLNNGRPKITKFAQDYDFEEANKSFAELRLKLSKLKIGGEAKSDQLVNGETGNPENNDNKADADKNEENAEQISVIYDKSKSFFDNVSSPMKNERKKSTKRINWRQAEQKLNAETFGVASPKVGNFYNRIGGGGVGGGAGSYYYHQQRNMNTRNTGNRNYRANMPANQVYYRRNNINPHSTGIPHLNKNQ